MSLKIITGNSQRTRLNWKKNIFEVLGAICELESKSWVKSQLLNAFTRNPPKDSIHEAIVEINKGSKCVKIKGENTYFLVDDGTVHIAIKKDKENYYRAMFAGFIILGESNDIE